MELYNTANVERFAVLNIHSFRLMKFWREYFHSALTSSAYYLTIVKYSQETFSSTLENCESLAQWIFLHLQYILMFNNTNTPFTCLSDQLLCLTNTIFSEE